MHLVFYVFISLFGALGAQDYSNFITSKICTDVSDASDACAQIARDQQIACNIVKSETDCIINAGVGLPQVSVLNAEEALIGAPLVSNNAVVFGEIVTEHEPYQTAVIVRNTGNSGFESLKHLRYCHPGFRHNELVSKYVLEEVASNVVNINCDEDNTTIAEKRIRAISEFFGPSCMPGRWVQNPELDKELKTKYSSLCDGCGEHKCDTIYRTPFNDSINCLINNGGDIALTSVNSAKYFFESNPIARNFQYFCPNGSTTANPCSWTRQLPRVVITSRDNAVAMKDYIKKNMPKFSTDSSFSTQSLNPDAREIYLAKLFKLQNEDRINLNVIVQPLKSYVESYRYIPVASDLAVCNRTVKWSTKNHAEQEKCLWTRQAALNTALYPPIECIQLSSDDVFSQIDSLANGSADIAYIDSDFAYIAKRKGLTGIAYPETINSQLNQIAVVIRSDNPDNIVRLSDLKDKPACFPQYGGKEWFAFLDFLRQKKLATNSCDYDEIFSSFVGGSCVPGARSSDFSLPEDIQEKLCHTCLPVSNLQTAKYCNADNGNKYFNTVGALQCVKDGAGSYAVITRNEVTPVIDASQFRILSSNDSVAEIVGFDIDENAYLSVVTAGEVAVKKDSSLTKDVELLLQEIEFYFGENPFKSFKVFEAFNNNTDALFPDSTPGLTFGDSGNNYVLNFVKMLKYSEVCVRETSSGSSSIFVTFFTFYVLTFIIIF